MTTLAESFLSRQEQDRITATVQQVEKNTSGEIVPMIVSRSDDYPMTTITGSISLGVPPAILLTIIIGNHIWIGPQNMWLFLLLATTICTVLSFPISKSDRIKTFFLNRKQVEKEVQKSALAAFYQERLYKTRDNNGILLYISVLEKKVWILADTSINEKIDQEEWDNIIAELTATLKDGDRCEAICRAIQQIGNILASHFPYKKDDTDELHNLIIR